MATLKAIADGTTYTLTGGAITYRMIMQNTGMAPVRTLTQRGPLQDGVTATGYRLDPRTIRITFMFQATSLSGADDRRSTIYNIFRPRAELMTLEETLDNGNVRRIDGRVTGAMDMPVTPLQDRIGVSQIFTVDFFCPDPTWYDPTASTTTFDSTDNVDWWLALGTIDAAEVEEYVENPTQGQSVDNSVSIADGSAWTVYFRTNVTTLSPASVEYALEFFSSSGFSLYGLIFPGGTLNRISTNSANIDGAFLTGLTDYIITSNGSTVSVYRNNSLFSSVAGTRGIDGTDAGTRWRSDSAGGSPWTPAIPYGAIYNIALNLTQRSSLISAANGTYDISKTINNAGNYIALPIITIVGPIQDAVFTNTTTGEVLDFTGITIAGGDTRVIDCRYGRKTVKNAAGTNKIADLAAASDLATFHLEPGDNAFTLEGTGTDANTQVTVVYNSRYIGL